MVAGYFSPSTLAPCPVGRTGPPVPEGRHWALGIGWVGAAAGRRAGLSSMRLIWLVIVIGGAAPTPPPFSLLIPSLCLASRINRWKDSVTRA